MHRLLLEVFILLFATFMVSQALPQPLSARSSQTTVITLAGPITGLKVSSSMYQFLGIPYAEPPTGTARFEAPTAYPFSLAEFLPFGGPSDPHSINATAFGSMCPQAAGGEENCLFLNVFTGTINPLALRPVMFWIHGGSFVEGSGSDPTFDGTALAEAGVVVVTYNYRLGILGFLDAPGFPTVNMGLQDTILALKWVQLNCLFFGGNPEKITIFGESSGGQMIRALMASPKAKGLFVRAIIQSDPQSYPLENRTISQTVVGQYALSQMACTTLSCAQGLSLSAIVAATSLVANVAPDLNPAVPITPLSPTIDGTWVAGDWSALIASGDLPNAVDVIMGTVLNEATPEIFSISPVPLPESEFEPIMGYFVGETRAEAICDCSEFQLNSSDTDAVRQTLSSVGTDFFWTCANQMNAISYSSQATVYLYQLLVGCTYSDNENDPLCTAPGVVCHEDDLSLVFGTCANPTSIQSAVSTELIGRWTAFATNGNPNIAKATQWSKVAGSADLNVLLLGSPDSVNQTLYPDLCGPIFGGTVPFNFQMF